MPVNKDFSLRIEIIDSCLRNHLRKWTLDGLVEAVSNKLEDRYGKTTSKRTTQNDLRFLIEQKNMYPKPKIGFYTSLWWCIWWERKAKRDYLTDLLITQNLIINGIR